MGVSKLNDIIRKHAPNAIKYVPYSDFKSQTWAIDASIFCYKFSYNAKNKKPNSHIDGFYALFYKLYKHGIKPILIFDGKAPDLKLNTIQQRKQRTIAIKDKIAQLRESDNVDQDQIDKLDASIIKFSDTLYTDLMTLCDLMNVPYRRAIGEADILCANLYKRGIVDAVLSNDTDMLMYGIEHLMRKYTYDDMIEHVDLTVILRELNINYDLFVDLCILCGTDYTTSTIPMCGPETSLQLVRDGKHIEDIETFYVFPSEEDFDYIAVRHLISNVYIDENVAELDIKVRNINWDLLKNYMHTKCNYRLNTIENHKLKTEQVMTPILVEDKSTIQQVPKLFKLKLKAKS